MELAQKYAEIHSSSAEIVRSGSYTPDAVPATGDSRWGLSLVVLPDPRIAQRLADAARELGRAAANPHIAYQPDDIHITVRSLEGHERPVSDETVRNYLDRIEPLTKNLDGLRIELRGLFTTRGGVIAGGHPNQVLTTLRSRLLQDWQAQGFESIPGGDADGSRDTAHTSLMVFRAGAHPETTLVDLIESAADTHFGTITARALALVSYQVTEDSIHLNHRAEITW